MVATCRNALIGLAWIWASGGILPAAAPVRPQLVQVTLDLEDGRSYSLSDEELSDRKGGVLFWNDWAVANVYTAAYMFSPGQGLNAATILRTWWTPGPSGQLPAFLIHTVSGPVYPLDPGGPARGALPSFFCWRPKVTRITVRYEDGRIYPFSDEAMTDRKSGVMVWNDYAITHFFIPFYSANRNLPTKPDDVMRMWFSPVPPMPSLVRVAVPDSELPGFLIKPRCVPTYPSE